MRKTNFTLKASDKNPKGGLTAKGRARYNKATGSNLKAPAPNPKTDSAKGRKNSFCARNKGQIDKFDIDCRKTPKKRACLARKRWNCKN